MNMGTVSIGQLIISGGPMMIPIILCSVMAGGIIIERIFYFRGISVDISKLKRDIFDRLKDNRLKEAIQVCQEKPAPVAKVLKAGILKYGYPSSEIKEAMETVSQFEIPKLEERLTALLTIAHTAPLLGILGTVIGITQCFYTIKVMENSLTPIMAGDLAAGIAAALLATAGGLMVAIPAFIFYNYFVSRTNRIILDMEKAALDLADFMARLVETKSPAPTE
jgi:biopolymer transport protein ExbB